MKNKRCYKKEELTVDDKKIYIGSINQMINTILNIRLTNEQSDQLLKVLEKERIYHNTYENYYKRNKTKLNNTNNVDEIHIVIRGCVICCFKNEKKVRDIIYESCFALDEGLYKYKSRIFDWYSATDVVETLSFSLNAFKKCVMENPVLNYIYINILETGVAYNMTHRRMLQTMNAIEKYSYFCSYHKKFLGKNDIDLKYVSSFLGMTLKRLREITPYVVVEFAIIEGYCEAIRIWPQFEENIKYWYDEGMNFLEYIFKNDEYFSETSIVSSTSKLQKVKEIYKEALRIATLLDKENIDCEILDIEKDNNSVLLEKEKLRKAINIIKEKGKMNNI